MQHLGGGVGGNSLALSKDLVSTTVTAADNMHTLAIINREVAMFGFEMVQEKDTFQEWWLVLSASF